MAKKSLAELRAQAADAHGEVLEVEIDKRKTLTFRNASVLRPSLLQSLADSANSKDDMKRLAAVESFLRSLLPATDRKAFDDADLGTGDLMSIFEAWADLNGLESPGNS